jgi:hypothetical protein
MDVDIATLSIVIAAVSVVMTAVFAMFQLRDLVKTRQTDLIMRLYSRFGSEEFQKTFEKVLGREAKSLREYEEKYGWAEWSAVGTFFEGIGILLRRKLINIGLVDDLFTAPVKMAWDMMKDGIVEVRKEEGQSTIFEWFEYLYNEMVKRERQLSARA